MQDKWVELSATGHLVFQSQRDQLMQKASKTKIPQDITHRFVPTLTQSGAEVVSQSKPKPEIIAQLDNILGNPDIARKTADNLLGLNYSNPYESHYALAYVTLMSTLKSHMQIEDTVKQASKMLQSGHKEFLIVDNWYELLKQVREIMAEKKVPWYQVKGMIREKKGKLSDEEARQCSFFAGSPDYTEQIFKEAEPLERLYEVVTESYTNVCYIVGSMNEVIETNVIGSNFEESRRRANEIESDVESVFRQALN